MNKKAKYIKPDHCQNCKKALSPEEEFCSACGQKALPEHLSLKYFLSEFLGNYFSFNSGLFKTLIPLMITPGFLSQEFVKGKRVRYIAPVQLFVFMSLVYFFLFSISSLKEPLKTDPQTGNKKSNLDSSIYIYSEDDTLESSLVYPDQPELDSLLGNSDEDKVIIQFLKKVNDYNKLDRKTKLEKFSRYLSYLIFLILPLFALYIYWFFHKSGRGYVESLIFSLHFHAFIFLLGIIFQLFDRLIPDPFDTNLQYALILIYLLVGLKKFFAYKLGSTMFRYLALLLTYGITVGFTLLTALFISILI